MAETESKDMGINQESDQEDVVRDGEDLEEPVGPNDEDKLVGNRMYELLKKTYPDHIFVNRDKSEAEAGLDLDSSCVFFAARERCEKEDPDGFPYALFETTVREGLMFDFSGDKDKVQDTMAQAIEIYEQAKSE